MKRLYQGMGLLVLLLVMSLIGGFKSKASSDDENVSVTVPSNVQIVFQEDGTNAVSDFEIENQSVVPIHITNVMVTSCNGWELVPKQETIHVNQKKLVFVFREQCLKEGDNFLQLTVPGKATQKIGIQVCRGAWSIGRPKEKAFELSFEYTLGKKEFQLTLASTEESVERIAVENGEYVKLSVPERMKYEFLGWEDQEGNLYQEEFLMPMKDVTLTAKWQWQEAYAIYSSADSSLRFVRSSKPISVGEIYRGKRVDAVFTGMEEKVYSSGDFPPWFYGYEVLSVEVLDYIQPKSTSYWFYGMYYAHTFDVAKIDTSRTEGMAAMFSGAGMYVTDTVAIRGVQNFDTSKVTYFGSAFRFVGQSAKHVYIDDISGWDTSSATNMWYMFCRAFQKADIYVDCSKWDVSKVTSHDNFTMETGGTVIEPKWVH